MEITLTVADFHAMIGVGPHTELTEKIPYSSYEAIFKLVFRSPQRISIASPAGTQKRCMDFAYDKDLIEQSIAKDYGILPSAQLGLLLSDWLQLIKGLGKDTSLTRVMQIRACKGLKDLQQYGEEGRRIHRDWSIFLAKQEGQVNTITKDNYKQIFGGNKK